jgi:hypothetical protein
MCGPYTERTGEQILRILTPELADVRFSNHVRMVSEGSDAHRSTGLTHAPIVPSPSVEGEEDFDPDRARSSSVVTWGTDITTTPPAKLGGAVESRHRAFFIGRSRNEAQIDLQLWCRSFRDEDDVAASVRQYIHP